MNDNVRLADGEIMDEFGCVYNQEGTRLLRTIKKSIKYCNVKFGVEIIDDFAFSSCIHLEKIVLPSSIKHLGNYAFGKCFSLKTIIFSDSGQLSMDNVLGIDSDDKCEGDTNSLQSIGNQTFKYCNSLKEFILPGSLLSIGIVPFPKGIQIKSYSKRFMIEDDCLIDVENGNLIQCLQDDNEIYIPNSVKSIGDYAFSFYRFIRKIVLPNTVESIGNNAFYYCNSLIDIDLPKSVSTIGNHAFNFCNSLKRIFLPASITSIGYSCFSDETLVVSLSEKYTWKNGMFIDIQNKTLLQCLSSSKEITVLDEVEIIGKNAFAYHHNLEKVVLPDSITSIGEQAFYRCKSLKCITLSSSIKSMEGNAFQMCSELEEILIPKGMTERFKGILNKRLHDKIKEIE